MIHDWRRRNVMYEICSFILCLPLLCSCGFTCTLVTMNLVFYVTSVMHVAKIKLLIVLGGRHDYNLLFRQICVFVYKFNHRAPLCSILLERMNNVLHFPEWSSQSQLNERHWFISFHVKKYECGLVLRLSVSHREPFYLFRWAVSGSLFTPLHRSVCWRWLMHSY